MEASVKTKARAFYCIVVGLLVLGGFAQAQLFAGGTGETGDPYRIATAEQLLAIGSDPSLLDKCFVLVADIDLDPNLPGGRVFEAALIAPDIPEGDGLDTPGVPFTGSFDGREHVIRNLVILAPTRSGVGLFGRIGIRGADGWERPAVVQNLRLESVTVTGHTMVGALAGVNEGTIINCSVSGYCAGEDDFVGALVGTNAGTIAICYAEGEVHGHDFVGGLAGDNLRGTMTECSYDGPVIGSEIVGGLVGRSSGFVATCSTSGIVEGGEHSGGLVGRNSGSVILSHSTSEIRGDDRTGGLVGTNLGVIAHSYAMGAVGGYETDEAIGGLVGWNSGSISDSHATGTVDGGEEVGGLVGHNNGTVVRCYATGDATSGEDVGGLVGVNRGRIEACYASGNVTNGDDEAGGLVGSNGGSIAQCYARGDVTSHETSGGLVGYNTGSITACYAVGRVRVTGDEGVGGLVGGAHGNPLTDSSFWDVDTTGFATRSNGGTGLHTVDLQMAQTYLDAGWDFVETWMICEGTDYPRLQWEQHNCEGDE
jgi:hypothetical protein